MCAISSTGNEQQLRLEGLCKQVDIHVSAHTMCLPSTSNEGNGPRPITIRTALETPNYTHLLRIRGLLFLSKFYFFDTVGSEVINSVRKLYIVFIMDNEWAILCTLLCKYEPSQM